MANREEWLKNLQEMAKPMSKNEYAEKDIKQYKRMIERRKLYLKEECIALYVYAMSGICFRIMDKYEGKIYVETTLRAKSPKSSRDKQERFNKEVEEGKRKNPDLYDIVAGKVVLKIVNLDTKTLSLFSDEVKARYNDTRANTYLLASVINFYKRQEEMGGFYLEENNEGIKEMVDTQLTACRTSFENITKNISRYNEKIGHTEIWRPNLESYIEKTINELIVEEEKESRKQKYKAIKKFLIAEQTVPPEEQDEQEEYYKYLISVLCRLRKAEYLGCTKSYNRINKELYKQLSKFYKLIEKGKFSDNVELKDLTKLAKWSEELNLHLSDKLESMIMKEIMSEVMALVFVDPHNFKNSNFSVSFEQNEDQTIKIDSVIKPNGYVAQHGKIELVITEADGETKIEFEVQGKSAYRDHVAGKEAAGGDKRKELGKEKERPISILPKKMIQTTFNEPETTKLKECIVIEGFGNIDEMTDKQKERWTRNINFVTPNYVTIKPDRENNSVNIIIASMQDNVKHYFGEIYNRKKLDEIRKGLEIIKDKGLLPSQTATIKLTREQYKNFSRNGGLNQLVQKVYRTCQEYKSNLKEEKNIEDPLQQ